MENAVIVAIRDAMRDFGLAFAQDPIVVGGRAMEYHGLRKTGEDMDLIITDGDYQRLAARHPDKRKDIWGDLGVVLWPFEIWRSIMYFDYAFYDKGAHTHDGLKVASLENLLLTRVYAMEEDKYRADLCLIRDRLLQERANPAYMAYMREHAHIYTKRRVVLGGNYGMEGE